MVWTVIPDSDIDPDSPITTGLMTAYRNNFAAMAAGDSGAPLITASVQLGTPIATTSGTSHDFTSIPNWAKKITVMFVGVSTSGTSKPIVQIGDSGGIENTGYLGSAARVSSTVSTTLFTVGLGIEAANTGNSIHGAVEFFLEDSNTWVGKATLSLSSSALTLTSSTSKTLSGSLDRIRLTTVGGSDTFDAGEINIMYS